MEFDISESGCTCCLIIHIGTHIICANTGDSRAIVVYDQTNDSNSKKLNSLQLVPLSIDYKPDNNVANINGLSDSFQKLYTKMVSYNPQERPSIEDILNSEWMMEIRDLNNQQMNDLENEIRQEFLKREILVNEQFKKTMEAKEDCSTDMSSGNRGGEDETNYFDLSLKPKFAQTGIGMKNYIKINGEMNPVLFMNNLCQRISKKIENCDIDANEYNLKFNVTFEEEEREEEIPKELEEELAKLGLDDKENEENEEDDNLTKKKSVIQAKMFESVNGGYLLRFKKKGGELEDYYKNLKKIMALAQE